MSAEEFVGNSSLPARSASEADARSDHSETPFERVGQRLSAIAEEFLGDSMELIDEHLAVAVANFESNQQLLRNALERRARAAKNTMQSTILTEVTLAWTSAALHESPDPLHSVSEQENSERNFSHASEHATSLTNEAGAAVVGLPDTDPLSAIIAAHRSMDGSSLSHERDDLDDQNSERRVENTSGSVFSGVTSYFSGDEFYFSNNLPFGAAEDEAPEVEGPGLNPPTEVLDDTTLPDRFQRAWADRPAVFVQRERRPVSTAILVESNPMLTADVRPAFSAAPPTTLQISPRLRSPADPGLLDEAEATHLTDVHATLPPNPPTAHRLKPAKRHKSRRKKAKASVDASTIERSGTEKMPTTERGSSDNGSVSEDHRVYSDGTAKTVSPTMADPPTMSGSRSKRRRHQSGHKSRPKRGRKKRAISAAPSLRDDSVTSKTDSVSPSLSKRGTKERTKRSTHAPKRKISGETEFPATKRAKIHASGASSSVSSAASSPPKRGKRTKRRISFETEDHSDIGEISDAKSESPWFTSVSVIEADDSDLATQDTFVEPASQDINGILYHSTDRFRSKKETRAIDRKVKAQGLDVPKTKIVRMLLDETTMDSTIFRGLFTPESGLYPHFFPVIMEWLNKRRCIYVLYIKPCYLYAFISDANGRGRGGKCWESRTRSPPSDCRVVLLQTSKKSPLEAWYELGVRPTKKQNMKAVCKALDAAVGESQIHAAIRVGDKTLQYDTDKRESCDVPDDPAWLNDMRADLRWWEIKQGALLSRPLPGMRGSHGAAAYTVVKADKPTFEVFAHHILDDSPVHPFATKLYQDNWLKRVRGEYNFEL